MAIHNLNRALRRKTQPAQTQMLSEILEIRALLAAGVQILDAETGLEISEKTAENNSTFRIVLSDAPNSDVVYSIDTQDFDDVTVSDADITFTPDNWDTPQTVTVTAIDDLFLEGTETGYLQISADDAQSDEAYHGDSANVFVRIHDHENAVTLSGPHSLNNFLFDASAAPNFSVTLNDETFDFTSDNLTITYIGGSESDTARLIGTPEREVATLIPGSAIIYGQDYAATVVYTESITTESGGGATDIVSMRDTSGDDVVEASPESVTLTGNSQSITAEGYRYVVARATNGTDSATFTDSTSVDTFVGKPDFAYLASSDFLILVEDFDSTEVFSENSGSNTAGLYDSDGNDVFVAGDDVSTMTGPGYSHTLHNFRSVRAYASEGNDTATLQDTDGDDLFVSRHRYTYLLTDDFYSFSIGFDSVSSTADAGDDIAHFYGTDEDFYDPDFTGAARFRVGEFSHYATGYTISSYGFDSPYDLALPDHDRDLVEIGREYVSSGALPNDYRFDYVRDMLDWRDSSEALSLGAEIMTQLPDYLESHPDSDLLNLTGYHELIEPSGSLELVESDYGTGVDRLELTDRLGLKSRVLHLQPTGTPKGQIILLHGSYATPEYLTGQDSLAGGGVEYHRDAALDWVAAGYEVFAPEMQGTTFESLSIIGYSGIGVESARVIDLIQTVKADNSGLPIAVVGLSRGATIAESVVALSDDVDALVTAGGALRHAPNATQIIGTSNFITQHLADKNIVISLGNMDTYGDWDYADAVIYAAEAQSAFQAEGGQMVTNFFVGVHEFWTDGDIEALEELLGL